MLYQTYLESMLDASCRSSTLQWNVKYPKASASTVQIFGGKHEGTCLCVCVPFCLDLFKEFFKGDSLLPTICLKPLKITLGWENLTVRTCNTWGCKISYLWRTGPPARCYVSFLGANNKDSHILHFPKIGVPLESIDVMISLFNPPHFFY